MFKRLFGTAVAAAVVAAGAKVVSDILKADEEEKNVIELDQPEVKEEVKEEEKEEVAMNNRYFLIPGG